MLIEVITDAATGEITQREVSREEAIERGLIQLPSPQLVNQERDRRLEADFEFQGKSYQRDRISLQRITGAATLAGFAVANGAQAGDYRWANPDSDFGWIASDNTVTLMDAPTCFAFGQAAANVETHLIFAAKQLRSMSPIPEDYTDDKWW